MLAGCWLLADLDGTLLSTPHKAHGRYVSLTSSPCYTPLQRWLHNGGSVCVVTTADMRALAQVYVPLRAHLAPSSSTPTTRTSSSETYGGGRLLLCLYTGAVLYHCTADGVQLAPTYTRSLHCATRESVELALQYRVASAMLRAPVVVGEGSAVDDNNSRSGGASTAVARAAATEERVCVRGTCIDARTSHTLLRHLVEVYTGYLRDVLCGDDAVLRAHSQLSRRYRDMWRHLLGLLDTLYACAQPGAAATAATGTATRSEEMVAWQLSYVRAHHDLYVALGIIRVEYVEARVCADDIVATVSQHDPARDGASVTSLTPAAAHAVSLLSRGLTWSSSAQEARAEACIAESCVHLTALLGTATPSAGAVPHDGDDEAAAAAQLIVLGVPIALFGRYFAQSLATFVRVGVQALPQPNSVVFCKLGVSKSTALRYLLGKDRVMGAARTACALDDNLAASIRTGCCVALGDNPQSTDYELTVFDDVPFVSVEAATQRSERHRRIARRLARTRAAEQHGVVLTLPDGRAAPSYAELCERRRRSGVLMDDTLPPHLLYVGGEEDGTATFLEALLCYLAVPALPRNHDSTTHGSTAAKTVTPGMFRDAVYAAQHAARHAVTRRSVQGSKL